jgi:predicted nuclease of predicted toxin-antitoxin system
LSAPYPFRIMLDAGAPDSVGDVFRTRGHFVILYREVLPEKQPDPVVCATALLNEAILIAVDADMKRLVRRYGAAPSHARFKQLHLIRIGCNGPMAAARVEQAMELLESEWAFAQAKAARRMWVDIGNHQITTHR